MRVRACACTEGSGYQTTENWTGDIGVSLGGDRMTRYNYNYTSREKVWFREALGVHASKSSTVMAFRRLICCIWWILIGAGEGEH